MKNQIYPRSLAMGTLSCCKWSLRLLCLLCLFGCEPYQPESLKVGQSETVAVEVMERYVDTKAVIERLEGQGVKIQLDSLLQLAEMMKSFDEAVAVAYAQKANLVATVNNLKQDLKLANQKNRQYEKKEQAIGQQQSVVKNWMIAGIGLTFSALIFLIVLQRLQQKRLLAKMEALRAQINPHFISNSLNAIESLVNLNKRKEAAKYLVHFSRLTRRILNGSREPFVSLTEALETLEHFLALEQLRFRDKLHYDIEVQKGVSPKLIQVPSMIMQPYVENAIWFGIKPKEEPGLLKIIIEKDKKNLVCIIEDNGIGRAKAKALKENSVLKHKSQGIQISKEGLEALGKMKGAKIQIIDLANKEGKAIGTRVILRFPLKYKN